MNAVQDLSQFVGKKAACIALTIPRATFYRYTSTAHRASVEETRSAPPPLALAPSEKPGGHRYPAL